MPRRHLSAVAALSLLTLTVVAAFAPDEAPPGLVRTLEGNKEAVYAVAFSPDGKFYLTGSGDPAVRIFSAADGKELKAFAGKDAAKGNVMSLAVSPDGSTFAAASADNILRLYDFPSSKSLKDFPHADNTTAVAVSADGSRVAFGGKDGKISVYNPTDGKRIAECVGHTGAVVSLAFVTNALLSAGADGTLRTFDPATGKPLAAVAAHPTAVASMGVYTTNPPFTVGPDGTLRSWALVAPKRTPESKDAVTALALATDGSAFAYAADKAIRVASVTTVQPTRDLPPTASKVTALGLPGGSATVVAGTAAGTLHAWTAKDGTPLLSTTAHSGGVAGVAVSPGNNAFATVGKDGVVRLWTLPPVAPKTLTADAPVRAVAASADDKRFAAAADKAVLLFSASNLKAAERRLAGHTATVNAVSISGDGKVVASGDADGVVRVWGSKDAEPPAVLAGHTAAVNAVALVGADGVLSASADGTFKYRRIHPPASRLSLSHAGAVTALAPSADGSKLLTGSADKQVRLWSTAKGTLERTWTGPTLTVGVVAFSPAGDRVAAGSADKSLTVWEAGSSKQLHKLTLPAGVSGLAWSADGKSVTCGLADGGVRLVDLATGKEARALVPHKGALTGLVSLGDKVASTGADAVVRVQPVAAGAAPVEIKLSAAGVSIAKTADNAKLAVGTTDKKVHVVTLVGGKIDASFAVPTEPASLAWSADGKKLLVADAAGQSRIVAIDGTLEEIIPHDGPAHAVAFLPGVSRAVVAGADKTARVSSPSLLWQGAHAGGVRSATMSARGDRLVTAGADGMVKLWDPNSGKLLQSVNAHAAGAVAALLNADNTKLVTVGGDKILRVRAVAKLPAEAGKDPAPSDFAVTLPGAPESLTLSADGKRAAVGVTAAAGERVIVVDTTTGAELATFGDGDPVGARSLSFRNDGRTLLAAGPGATARLVDTPVAAAWAAHAGGCTSVAYNPAGTLLITGGADKTAKVWTVATGKLECTVGPLDAVVDGVAFSRDGTRFAVAAGKKLAAYTAADGKELLALDLPSPAAGGVQFNSDGKSVVVGGADGKARVLDVATKSESCAFLTTGAVAGVAWLPFAPTQLLVAGDKSVSLETNPLRFSVPAGKTPSGVAPTADAARVVTVGAEGKAEIRNATTGVVERTIEVGKPLTCTAVAKSVQVVAVGSSDKKVRFYNFADGKLLAEATLAGEPRAMSFTTNNNALIVAAKDGTVTAFDAAYQAGQPLPEGFGRVMQTFAHGADAFDVATPATGSAVYTAGAEANGKAFRLASESPLVSLSHPGSVNSVAFTKDGTHLVSGCGDGKLRVYDATKRSLLKEVAAHPAKAGDTTSLVSVYAVAVSPDGKLAATASADQTLKLVSLPDGKVVREIKAFKEKESPQGHSDAVLCVAFSPDGKQLASGGMDRAVKIWDAATGTFVRELTDPALKTSAHSGWVYSLKWLDGGKKLVSVAQAPRLAGSLAVWDAAGGKLISSKELAIGTIYSLAASPDEKTLILGTGGSIRSTRNLNLAWVIKGP